MRGVATEIYHEGIRILGVKVVEKGEFRNDVFKTIVEQCRDPEYVGLDLKSRIAGNNVSAAQFLHLVEQFGPEFVEAAGAKMIDDAEQQARAKLRSLPDGTWKSRMYGTGRLPGAVDTVECTMRKDGEELYFDFTGTSPQAPDDHNSTYPSSMAHLALALTNFLFWDVPWSDGKMHPVHVTIPSGSLLNCQFPSACGGGPGVGRILVAAVTECVSKMLYAAGRHHEVNAGWQGVWYTGGPGMFYGGHNREGITVAQGLYDQHGGGFGARPRRDGVDTGGHHNIPSGGISDIEVIEMQYPFLYFTRAHNPNGAGYGKHRGGDGSHRVLLVFGSGDLSVDFRAYVGVPYGYGLFGGYPGGTGGLRGIFRTDPARIRQRLATGEYPTSPREVIEGGWGEVHIPQGAHRVAVPEWWILTDFVPGGGGFGDPLERDPAAVAYDVQTGIYTRWGAESFFGVRLAETADQKPDLSGTEQLRAQIRRERLAAARPTSSLPGISGRLTYLASETMRADSHAGLSISGAGRGATWTCKHCAQRLGPADDDYHDGTVVRVRSLMELAEYPLPSGDFLGQMLEFLCPGCGTLLDVEVRCEGA
jgi:N-methylhydantoinase B